MYARVWVKIWTCTLSGLEIHGMHRSVFFWKEDRRNFGWPPRSRGTAARFARCRTPLSILAPLWFGLNSRTCFSIWDLQWFDTYFYSTSFSDYKIHKKLHVCVTVDQDGMKRLGTENLFRSQFYENFEVSPAKPIWRSFCFTKILITFLRSLEALYHTKFEQYHAKPHLSTSILVYLMSANSFCGLQTEVL